MKEDASPDRRQWVNKDINLFIYMDIILIRIFPQENLIDNSI
jgi:hypothetical protein